MTNGPSSNRIDIVILGDGYTVAQQAQFLTDATRLKTALFNTSPWREYQALFNVSAVHLISNQDGADNGSFGATRDTALGAWFNCQQVDRLLCINDAAAWAVLSQAAPNYNMVFVLVNDPKYGGSGGSISVASTHANSLQVLLHETGHSVGSLADEYELAFDGYPPCTNDCFEANATLDATSSVKWSMWIDQMTPIPTPEGSSSWGCQSAADLWPVLGLLLWRPRRSARTGRP